MFAAACDQQVGKVGTHTHTYTHPHSLSKACPKGSASGSFSASALPSMQLPNGTMSLKGAAGINSPYYVMAINAN